MIEDTRDRSSCGNLDESLRYGNESVDLIDEENRQQFRFLQIHPIDVVSESSFVFVEVVVSFALLATEESRLLSKWWFRLLFSPRVRPSFQERRRSEAEEHEHGRISFKLSSLSHRSV